jgi:putative ABC transport system substrate-binding protein
MVRRGLSLTLWLVLVLLVGQQAASAQPAGRVYRIGFLANSLETSDGPLFEVFISELKKLGYVEDKNFVIDWRSSEGHSDRLPQLAQELVRVKVDVIVASSAQPARAAADATNTIPIVFPVAANPMGQELVGNRRHPRANVTGAAIYDPRDLNARLLRLVKEALPKLSRLAVLSNPANSSHLQLLAREIPTAASSAKLSLLPVELRSVAELESTLDGAVRDGAQSLYVLPDPLSFIHRAKIAEAAVQRRLPTIYTSRTGVEAGGLLSHGPRLREAYQRAATYVDRILKGTKPSDLPVDLAPAFETVVNLKTAKALGLTLPAPVLRRADQVLQ